MRIDPTDRAWLEASGLVDPEVDLDVVSLHTRGPLAWYLRLVGRGAITLGDGVWYREASRVHDRALLVHELVHVAQYRRLGRLRFVASYLRDLLRAGFRYSRSLPLEAPAYERQAQARALLRSAPE